jgi:hypothetical protein
MKNEQPRCRPNSLSVSTRDTGRKTASVESSEEGVDERGRSRRTRPVERQPEGGQIPLQLVPPVAEQGLQGIAGEMPALPHGIIGILQRNVGQRRSEAAAESLAEDCKLTDQDRRGPAIADDVMHREDGHVLLGGQAQQRRPQQRSPGQVERLEGHHVTQVGRLRLAQSRGQRGQIDDRQRSPGRRPNDLEGGLLRLGERRPQSLVTPHQLVQAGTQNGHAEPASKPHGDGQVVGHGAGVEAVEKPEPLLAERERQLAIAWNRLDRRQFHAGALPHQGVKDNAESRDGGSLEQMMNPQLDLEQLAGP